ncbi:MAG: ATP-dependent Clp protease ATP-binding subunit [Gemmatimonadaceae bacterium]|nr:ATP-dependent Clp protease ATP-binding subunit [Gemmatimonadaceae bacterium]
MSEVDLGRPVTGALARFTRDLTREATAGRLEPVRCRDEEIARLMDILLRHGKNNAALVGPAGVGKTAIAEGLAQRLLANGVPLMLRSARILALDHVALLAGTAYRGQYEERIRALVAEASADPDVVLFIDELHNLIGQGSGLGVAMDAANMLKPALVRGDFRVIGATTTEEYERWIQGDPALERRFQRLIVRELTSEETIDVLEARRERLERHHHVIISTEALRASVTLTDEHVKDRRRPDRAIDALDEACAHVQATTSYSVEAEALIQAARRARRLRVHEVRPAENPAPSVEPIAAPEGEEDSLGRFARDGFAALQQFGAELEAIIAGGPDDPPPARTSVAVSPVVQVAPTPLVVPASPLLTDILQRDGVYVRATDVARVVAVATGQTVRWTE